MKLNSKSSGITPLVSYAQNREDIILSGFLNGVKNGFYIDVGANDPTRDSVTKFFYDQGWSGINIEPNKVPFEQLQIKRPRDINLNIGLGSRETTGRFRVYDASGLSTFSKKMQTTYKQQKRSDTKKYEDQEMLLGTLSDVVKEYSSGKTIHFLKIDVEGFEHEVLRGANWTSFRPWVICIEADHVEKDWRQILLDHNYDLVFFDGLNEYYLSHEKNDLKDTFSYPETILFHPVIDLRVKQLIDALEHEKRTYETNNMRLQKQNESLKNENAFLNTYIDNSRRLRNIIFELYKSTDKTILLQIEKLNRKKIRAISLHSSNMLKRDMSALKADEVITLLRLTDSVTYFNKDNVRNSRDGNLYRIALRTYLSVRNITKSLAKSTWRSIRRVKRSLKR